MNQKIKSALNQEYGQFIKYVKENPIRCIRASLESLAMCTLMVSWIFYIMKPYLDDMNNYGVGHMNYDPIVVFSIAGFVFLSFFFLMSTGWYYINKGLKRILGRYERPLTESQDGKLEDEK